MSADSDKAVLSIADKLSLLGIYILLGTLALFPLSWVRALGSKVGKLYYRLAKKRVHIARINVQLCFPNLLDQEREDLVKRTFQAAGMWFFESGAIWLWPADKILKHIDVENESVFRDAINAGNGVMLSIPHLGNWEIMGPYTSSRSEFACFFQHQNQNAAFSEFVRRSRTSSGTLMAPANAFGIRRLYKHLQQGKVAGLLPDHFPSDNMGVFAPFFGNPALTGTLISSLAKKNDAPIITAATIRTDKGFKIQFFKVDTNEDKDPILAATALNKTIEQAVLLAPEQFQWFYPRFRRRPDPDKTPDPYRSTRDF